MELPSIESIEVDTCFHNRSRASQIGAAASTQSQVLVSRDELEAQVRAFAEAHPSEIPRSDFLAWILCGAGPDRASGSTAPTGSMTAFRFRKKAQDGELRASIRDELARPHGPFLSPVCSSLSQHPDQVKQHQHIGHQEPHPHPCQLSHQFVYLERQE
jgi:hypothetical protein